MKTSFKPVEEAKALQALLDRDRKYATDRFPFFAAREIRLYRPGNLPYIGGQAASDALAKTKGHIAWQPIGGDVSRAGDFGYTHGTYEMTDDTKKEIEKGSYVRIWKKQDNVWRFVIDVVNVH